MHRPPPPSRRRAAFRAVISTVATGPRPRSRCASIATPWASISGLARRSSAASAVSSDRLEQGLDVGALLCRDVDEHGVAAEVLGHQVVFGELRPDLGRVGAFLVDLVDRHHDRHVGGLRVVDGLHRLRHNAVVGGDHQDRDVGGLRTAGTHGGERLVTRSVDEGDRPYRAVEVDLDLVCADVLGDAACFFLADVGLTDRVQQSGLAVVDVTHDGHHRRTGLEIVLATLVLAVREVEGLQQLAVLVLRRHHLDDVVHLAAEQLEGLVADRLRRGHHLAEVEQRLHQSGRVGVDLLGEVAQRRATGQPDGLAVAVRQPHATDDRRLHVLVFGAFGPLRLAAALRGAAGTTEGACSSAALARASTTAAASWTTAVAASCGSTATTARATGTAWTTSTAVVTATAAGATWTATGACAGTTTTRAGPGAAGGRSGATGTTGRSGTRGATGTRGHIARRHTRPRGAGTGCLWTRNRPLDRLRRGERVVADARGTRGGLRRSGRGAGPRTRRCAGSRSRAGRCLHRRRGRSRGGRGRRVPWAPRGQPGPEPLAWLRLRGRALRRGRPLPRQAWPASRCRRS